MPIMIWYSKNFIVSFPNCHFCLILILEYCPQEDGFCVTKTGADQNSGVIGKGSITILNGNTIEAQEKCLEICKQNDGATGCEVIWGGTNVNCYVHTQEIARGNGVANHACWVFSKCVGI